MNLKLPQVHWPRWLTLEGFPTNGALALSGALIWLTVYLLYAR
ncbi:MAG: hypothetical protein ACFB3T_12175 [Geminicoccaceae bacterium]